MTREEAKEMFRSDKDSYGKPKAVMHKIDKIYDEFEAMQSVTPESREGKASESDQKPKEVGKDFFAEDLDDFDPKDVVEDQKDNPVVERIKANISNEKAVVTKWIEEDKDELIEAQRELAFLVKWMKSFNLYSDNSSFTLGYREMQARANHLRTRIKELTEK